MKVERVESRIVNIPLRRPYVFSHGAIDAFKNVVVWIYTDEGIRGVGEADVIPSVSEETPEGIKYVIDRYLGPLIVGKDPFDTPLILEEMDGFIPGNLAAKAGIDVALLDLKGKALNLPAYKLLGGKYKTRILVDYTIGIDTPENMAKEAVFRRNQGYSTLVVKIGHDLDTDIQRMKLVREAVGPDVNIRLDANEGYRPDQAIKTIKRLERYDPELVEEPVKRWDLDGMAKVARAVDTPISSDESNTTLQSALQIIDSEAADILNLKITKNGGIYNCIKIAAVAEAAGIPCLVGGMTTFEITRQASRHFAACTPQVQRGYASEGCGPASQALEDDIVKTPITYEDVSRMGGYVEVSHKPGLGAELDGEKIRKYVVS
ncbi:MAG: mandelate racemase/muconate lactonizing enzyme family protein [Candidatus Geothermarchaeales archaeon]